MPPLGFRCRCSSLSLTEAQARQRGWKGWPELPAEGRADPGWDYDKLTGQDAMLDKIAAQKLAKANKVVAAKAREVLDNIGMNAAKPMFEAQKTAKAAAEWAVNNNLADFADYSGIKPEVANAWNKSLFDHLQEFPELRKDMKFVGTCQEQYARWREIEIQKYIAKLQAANPQVPTGFDFRPHAERYVKAKKVDGSTWAHAWKQDDVGGVVVNKKWGADVVAFEKSIVANEANQWHPVGCNTIKSVVDHELGHMLDYHLDLRFDSDVVQAYNEATAKGMKGEVSGYAAKNIKEFIAECWAESLSNPSPRPYAQRVAGIVRSRYKAKYP